MVISSISNEKVKLLRSVSQTKGRREHGLYLAEGANLLKDIPDPKAVRYLFVKESKADSFKEILDRFPAERILLTDELFDRVSDTVTPAGIAALVEIPKPSDISEVIEEKIIVLDHVADAGNVGAILRTAVAAGYQKAVLIGCADPYSPKAVRASMSAIFKVALCFCDNKTFLCWC